MATVAMKPSGHRHKGKHSLSRIRIIGGQWRSRQLSVPLVDGLRPTGERVRETLFNWLSPYIHGSRCLDLFAGTGALGLEALSRGASFCQFVEQDPSANRLLHDNIAKLTDERDSYHLAQTDAGLFLQSHANTKSFDIVFMDPPFAQDLWQTSFQHLLSGGWLHLGTLIYLEQPKQGIYAPPACRRIKHKIAGQVSFSLYCFDGEQKPIQ